MSQSIKKSLIALTVSSALIAPSAFATNGYFAHGYSTAEKGLAGAGAAHSSDSLASATNPAGLVKVGSRFDVGAAIFNPNRQYTADTPAGTPLPGGAPPFPLTPGTYESAHDYFLIPHIGYSSMIDGTSAWGIAAYGNGGMNTDYQTVSNPNGTTGTFYAGNAGVNLAQLFINLSYSMQINNDHAFGASLIMAYQMFRASGLGSFASFSTNAAALSDNGDDSSLGFGAKLGWQGDVSDVLTLGVSYQSKIAMSEFDKYAGLFAEGGDFDIPATATVGLAWKTSKSSTLVFDIQQIYYSDVAALGNSVEGLFACGGGDASQCLGGANGAGFGWDDMTIYKLGYEWGNDVVWRVGVSNGKQPIPDGTTGSQTMFNILTPAVVETAITAGFTMPLSPDSELAFAAMYAPSKTVTGSTQFDNQQTVALEMDQFEIQGTYTMKF